MKKPIFIIGSPRSGTSMVLEILAFHEEVAWVSNMVTFLPKHLYLSVFNRIYDIPGLSEKFWFMVSRTSGTLPKKIKRYMPRPSEPWGFWDTYLPNFQWKRGGTVPPRRRTREDISQKEIRDVKSAVDSVCFYHGKKRFLSKYTDFPRIEYLRQAFPDALFLHIVRDGRAVAASYYEKISRGVFANWEEREWWIKGWPENWRNEWLENYNTQLSFVVFQWKFFLSEIWKDAEQLPDSQYKEVNYKDIISSPLESFDTILDFCRLKESKRIKSLIDNLRFENMNKKWKKFSEEEKKMLNDIINEPEFQRVLDE